MAWDGFFVSEGPGREGVGVVSIPDHPLCNLRDWAGLLRDTEGLEGIGAEEFRESFFRHSCFSEFYDGQQHAFEARQAAGTVLLVLKRVWGMVALHPVDGAVEEGVPD